ncbi:MAG: putative toxin-antitoxin system toxin component, PIN family [Chloroflexota bacterium]
MLVVLDTNVLVSGLLNPKGPPGKILDLVMDNQIQVAYDDRILGEYEEVLSRPELRFHPWRIKAVIDHIELSGKYVTSAPFPTEGFPDPDDLMFAEVFITSEADALVTGNLKHFAPLVGRNLPVLSPARFLETY